MSKDKTTKGIRLENTTDLEVDLTEGGHSVTASQYWCRGIFASFRGRVKQKQHDHARKKQKTDLF